MTEKIKIIILILAILSFCGCLQKDLPYINIGIQQRNHLLTVFVNNEPVIINYSTSIGMMNLNPYMVLGKNTIRVEGDVTSRTNDSDPTVFQIRAGDGDFFGDSIVLYEVSFDAGPFKSDELIVETNLPNQIGFEDLEDMPASFSDEDILKGLSMHLESIKENYESRTIPDEVPVEQHKIIKKVFSYEDMTYYVNDIKNIGFVRGLKTVLFYTKNHKQISFAGRSDNYESKVDETVYNLGQEFLRFGYVNGEFKPIW